MDVVTVRGASLVSAFLLAVGEPVVAPPDGDLLRYALTQGGLAVVVLVLMWSYRRDFTRILDAKEDRLVVMATMVSANIAAATRSAEASEAQQQAIERLSRVVDRLDERRSVFDRRTAPKGAAG
jgi:hypothetical protein